MLVQPIQESSQPAHVVVGASEKGGSGKSTTAVRIAVALLKAGQRVATVDLDGRQKTFNHYIQNRRAGGERAVDRYPGKTIKFFGRYFVARAIPNQLFR
jgi:chromosome partitioning protein